MLPQGCSYIPNRKAARAAKDLDIDFANACVRSGFIFLDTVYISWTFCYPRNFGYCCLLGYGEGSDRENRGAKTYE